MSRSRVEDFRTDFGPGHAGQPSVLFVDGRNLATRSEDRTCNEFVLFKIITYGMAIRPREAVNLRAEAFGYLT